MNIICIRAEKTSGGKIMANVCLRVNGMHCQNCVDKVSGSVAGLNGITNVNVSLESGLVDVDYDDSLINQTDIMRAIINVGYEAQQQ